MSSFGFDEIDVSNNVLTCNQTLFLGHLMNFGKQLAETDGQCLTFLSIQYTVLAKQNWI
jgi:hypothetical protein